MSYFVTTFVPHLKLICILYIIMIKVSEIAKKKVIQMMSEDGFDANNDFVRVGVKSGGCSGLSYDLKFDKNKSEGDKVFKDN